MIHFHALGGLTVADQDGHPISIGGPRLRRLLAILLIHRNEVVSVDRLAEAVFAGEPTAAASTTLRSYVARIRKALDRDGAAATVSTRAPGYALRLPDEAFDVARFEHLVAEAASRLARDDAARAATAAHDALELWRGAAYAEFADEEWAMPEAQRLEELRLVAHERRIEAELACGRAADVIAAAESLARENPLREGVRAQLMLALYRTGRQAEALHVYRDYRELLVEELGVDPTPRLAELERRILSHDPSLALAEPAWRPLRGYRLGERLGTGRHGTVYAADLPGVVRDVVVRVIPEEIADSPGFVRTFEASAQRLAALHHPAIVPIHDYWREPGAAHLVMRRMYGGTLADVLQRGSLGAGGVATLVSRIGGALVAAAEQGITHGRVSPESVLLDKDGDPYLTDFGLGADERPPTSGVDVHDLAVLVERCLPPDLRSGGRSAVGEWLSRGRAGADRPPLAEFVPSLVEALTGAAVPAELPNPYKGLRAFDESDAADFFGRTGLVAEILDRLTRDDPTGRLVLVVGGSGTGKSSVVRAGLLPRVRSDRDWFVTTMLPGSSPYKELAESLRRIAVTEETPPAGPLADRLVESGGIDRVLRELVPVGGQLLLVVDQLEELFTMAAESDQRAFLAGILHAVSTEESRLRVVATLRADFYDRPLGVPGFGAVVNAATVTLPAMSAGELDAAVGEPIERVGGSIEPALVAELVRGVADEPAALPALQFTLYELAERSPEKRLTLAAYRDLGGVEGAIAARAEALYTGLDDTARAGVRRMFERLVVVGAEGEPTRRRTPRTELPAGADVDRWAQARLLTLDRDPRTRVPTAEVAHEAMLREWPRLRRWIEDDRESLLVLGQLREAARAWHELDGDPGALYRGARLEVACESVGSDVPDLERAFLDASVAERDREQRVAEEHLADQARANRRLRIQLAVIAVALLVALAGGLVAVDQRRDAQTERRVAFARELATASRASLEEDPERSILLALAAIDQTRSDDGTVLQEAEEALHRAVTSSRVVLSVPGLGGAVDWSPAGDVFVTEGPEESGRIDLRDPGTGESVRSWQGHDIDINDATFNEDGSRLATAGDDGAVRVWNPDTGDLLAEYADEQDGVVFGPSLSPDGNRVAAVWLDAGAVRVVDLSTSEVVTEITGVDTEGLEFSPDGALLAFGGPGREFGPDEVGGAVADAASGELLFPLPTDVYVNDVAWSPDGRLIATADRDGSVDVRTADTGDLRFTIDAHSVEAKRLAWSDDSTRLATAGADGAARVWEVTGTGARRLLSLSAQATTGGGMYDVAFSPDGQRLLTGDLAVSAAKVWDISPAAASEGAVVDTDAFNLFARLTAGGNAIIGASTTGGVAIWDAESGDVLRRFSPTGTPVDLSPDGALLVTVDPVRVWDVASEDLVHAVDLAGPSTIGGWSDDSELHAIGWLDQATPRVTVVDRSGAEVATFDGEPGFVFTATSFSPDGTLLATSRQAQDRNTPQGNVVQIWDWRRGTVVRTIETPVSHVEFDRTGTRLVTGHGFESTAQVWDVASGELLATLAGHTGPLGRFAVSPDGSRVATSSADATVRIWDLATGAELLTLDTGFGVAAVDFSPDGSTLLSVNIDGLARAWAMELDQLIGIAHDRLTRGFTEDECRQYLHLDQCPVPDESV